MTGAMLKYAGALSWPRSVCCCALLVGLLALSACSSIPPSNVRSNARLTPSNNITRALKQLPEPREKIAVAVYGLRDQTGQYLASPDSPYSTAVTQGAATMLVEALWESGWYMPVEREGLQNLLTERRIVRAIESPTDKGKPIINLPNLLPASLIIEGGITAYESNVRTGGKGASVLGVGADTQYRVDQVTVGLRSVDIRTGRILNTVAVTKTIYSFKVDANVYRFSSYKKLLQGETGFTTNEPAQLAVREAIEAAVVHLTALGVRDHVLELKDDSDWANPVIQSALRERENNLGLDANTDDDIEEGMISPRALATAPAVRPLVRPAPRPAPPEEYPASESPPPAQPQADTAPAAGGDAPAPANAAKPGAAVPKPGAAGDDIFKMYWGGAAVRR